MICLALPYRLLPMIAKNGRKKSDFNILLLHCIGMQRNTQEPPDEEWASLPLMVAFRAGEGREGPDGRARGQYSILSL